MGETTDGSGWEAYAGVVLAVQFYGHEYLPAYNVCAPPLQYLRCVRG